MRARAALASAAIDEAVEEDGLLREDQPRARTRGLQLHCRQRHRDALAVDMHAVGKANPPIPHDVPVARIVVGRSPAWKYAAQALAPTLAEIELATRGLPLRRPDEPVGLCGGVGPGLEHLRW